MRDAQMDDLLRKVLSERPRESSQSCANENLMAAYLESELSPRETAEFESHVAECAYCREILALSMKMQPRDPAVHPVPAGDARRTLFRFAIPVPILGALILAVVLVPVVYKAVKKPSLPETQVAEVRAPLQKAEVPETDAPAAPQGYRLQKGSIEREGREAEKRAPEPRILEKKTEMAAAADAAAQGLAPAAAVGDEATEKARTRVSPSGALKSESGMPDAETLSASVHQSEKLAIAAAPAPPPPTPAPEAGRAVSMLNSQGPVALNAVRPNEVLLGSGKDESKRKDAESRHIGDKVFYRNAGMWIDRQSTEHRDRPIIEILPAVPEHKSIVTKYPALRSLLPVVIYWKGTNYLLR